MNKLPKLVNAQTAKKGKGSAAQCEFVVDKINNIGSQRC